jgi:hypothetical protein
MRDPAIWEKANQMQILATRLTPYDTEALLMMNVLEFSRQYIPSELNIDDAKSKYRIVNVSISYLLKALESNPADPRLWMHIAARKHQIKQYDELFFTALSHATTLAPKNWDQQVKVVYIGLEGWEALAETSARPVIEKALQQTYKMDRKMARGIVNSMAATDITLPWE